MDEKRRHSAGESVKAEDPRIEKLNEALESAGEILGPIRLAVVPIESLDLLEENARWMRHEMFKNLVDNIKRDGALTSVPYCWKNADRFLVLSGNHRVKAAREAGLERILILYNERELNEQERIAIQLSHNAIAGEDDPVLLKALWDKLEDVGIKHYAGLDDKTLKELEKITLSPLSEVNLDFRQATFVFLPEELERVDAVLKKALETVCSDYVYLARFADFDRKLDALAKTKDSYNTRNGATALMLILDLFEKHQAELAEGWADREETKNASWVPLASIFGGDRVPIESAKVIRQAAERMMDTGDVTKKNLWQAVEFWAAEYLAGT